jgi:hypothetical protein
MACDGERRQLGECGSEPQKRLDVDGWWSEVKRRGDTGRRDGEVERGGGMQESGRMMEKTR